MEREFISERQASLLLEVSNRTVKIWRDNGYLDDFMILHPNEKRASAFYIKDELLKWFVKHLESKRGKKARGKPLMNHKNN